MERSKKLGQRRGRDWWSSKCVCVCLAITHVNCLQSTYAGYLALRLTLENIENRWYITQSSEGLQIVEI